MTKPKKPTVRQLEAAKKAVEKLGKQMKEAMLKYNRLREDRGELG